MRILLESLSSILALGALCSQTITKGFELIPQTDCLDDFLMAHSHTSFLEVAILKSYVTSIIS